jgi:hypothetical protein
MWTIAREGSIRRFHWRVSRWDSPEPITTSTSTSSERIASVAQSDPP